MDMDCYDCKYCNDRDDRCENPQSANFWKNIGDVRECLDAEAIEEDDWEEDV